MQKFLEDMEPRLKHFLIHNCEIETQDDFLFAVEAYGLSSPEDIDIYFGTKGTLDGEDEIYVSDYLEYPIKVVDGGEDRIKIYYTPGTEDNLDEVVTEVASRMESHVIVDTVKTTPYRLGKYKKVDTLTKFKRLVLEADMRDASDIYLYVVSVYGTLDVRPVVSCRISGDKYPLLSVELTPKEIDEIIKSSIRNMTHRLDSDLESSKGVEASIIDPISDGELTLRISALKTRWSYKATYRIHREKGLIKTFQELNLEDKVSDMLERMTRKRSGITLIAGAMGQGKTNTINAMVSLMEGNNLEIMEISHPNENRLPVSQVDYEGDFTQLGDYISLARKQALDAIMINEINNKNVAKASFDLVTSNVHVLTTIHLGRVYHLPYKLKSFLDNEYKDIFPLLNLCYTQVLVKELCQKCKSERSLETLDKKHRVLLEEYEYDKHFYYTQEGCVTCNNPSYVAYRRPFVEYLEFDPALIDELMGIDEPFGMQSTMKRTMRERRTLMEYSLLSGISKGILGMDSLNIVL